MEHLWILIAIAGGFFQAIRMAALKVLNRELSAMVATYVRAIVGLPFFLGYFVLVMRISGEAWPEMSTAFLLHCFGGAVTQFFGTVLLVYLLTLGNFAVGIMVTKADVVMTALIGSLLFSEVITGPGLAAMLVVSAGVVLVSSGRMKLEKSGGGLLRQLWSRPTQIGLAVGLIYSFSYLFLREASLEMSRGNAAYRAAFTLLVITAMQFVLIGLWLAWREPDGLRQLPRHWRLGLFLGVVSALGSLGWFTATAMKNASYVAAVAQTQVVFLLLFSRYLFGERTMRIELVGMAVICAGVVLFRLA